MITTDTTNKLGATVTKGLRTVMQDYDFNLSKLERVMSGAGKVAALGHELERRGLKRTIVARSPQRHQPVLRVVHAGSGYPAAIAAADGRREHVRRRH